MQYLHETEIVSNCVENNTKTNIFPIEEIFRFAIKL